MSTETRIAELIAQADPLRASGSEPDKLTWLVDEINRLRDMQCRGIVDNSAEPQKPRRGRPPKAKP